MGSAAHHGDLAVSPGETGGGDGLSDATRLTLRGDDSRGRVQSRPGTQVELGRATWEDMMNPFWRENTQNLQFWEKEQHQE